MTKKQASKLKQGDEVYWNDPEAGKLSRWFTLLVDAEINGDIITLIDEGGATLECFAEELS
jgi:hypothetical protein